MGQQFALITETYKYSLSSAYTVASRKVHMSSIIFLHKISEAVFSVFYPVPVMIAPRIDLRQENFLWSKSVTVS